MGKAWETGSRQYSTKPIVFGEPGKLVLIFFPIVWVFFSIRFPSCGILHHMGNAWVFSSIPHSMRKGRKTHQMGEAWEIGFKVNSTKPIVCKEPGKLVLMLFPQYGIFFPIRFTSYGILYNMWNAWVSPSISHSMRKCSEIHRIGKAWEIGTHFSPTYGYFSSIRFPSYGIISHIGKHGFSHQFLITRENEAKTSSQVVFLQYDCFYLFQNLVIPLKRKQKKTDKVNYFF